MRSGVDIDGNGVGNYTFIVSLPVSFINMRDCFMNGRRIVSLIYCVAPQTSTVSCLFIAIYRMLSALMSYALTRP